MVKIILTLLLFALPLIIDNTCYEAGYVKNVILYIGSIWIAYFLWIKKPKLPDYSVLLFLGWCALSYLVNPYKTGNPGEEMIILTCYLIVYIASRDYLTVNMLRICLEWIIYILVGVLIYTIWGNWSYWISNFKDFGCFEYESTFGIAGGMASWLIMAILLLLAGRRYIACFMGLFLLWLTGSRSGALGAILGFSVLLYALLSKVWLKRLAFGAGILFLVVIFYVYTPKLSSQAERFSYWQSALNMTIDRPVAGYGIGSFRVIYPKYRNPYITESYKTPNIDLHHTHSWPLEMGSEIGIIGVCLFLFLIYRHWKMGREWGLITGVFAVLIANLTDVAFYYLPIGFMLWVYLGLMARDITDKNWFDNMMDDFYNR